MGPLLLAALAASASAATPISIDVTTLADQTAADGQCSLREAIALVNAGDQPLGDEPGGCRIEQGAAVSRIGFAPALTSSGPAALTISATPIDIAAPLHLHGSGRDLVTLEGDGHTRLFQVAAGIAGNVSFSELTLAQGEAVDDGRGFRVGGAIRALSPLLLDRVRVAGTTGGSGVAVESTSLDVSDTEFIHNSGAVDVLGHVPDPSLRAPSQASIRRSQFLENGVGLRVIGVQNQPQESHAELLDSIFSRNTVSTVVAIWTSFDLVSSTISDNSLPNSAAGGISASHSTVHVANSTISGNTGHEAGAIFLVASTVELVNSTIAGNSAISGAGDSFTARIEAGRDRNLVTATNTILTSHSAACDTTPLLPLHGSNNILASDQGGDTSCAADAGAAQLMTLDQLKLAGLAENGGSTPTRALQDGSPAIDAGTDTGCPPADQRGSARSAPCDIGAFEAAPPTTSVTLDDAHGHPTTISTDAGAIDNASSISQVPPGAPATFTYPVGFFSYRVTGLVAGGTAHVTFALLAGTHPAAAIKCSASGSACAQFAGVSIAGDSVTLTLVDGGAGDDDGVANGAISDPVGMAVPVSGGGAVQAPPVSSGGGGALVMPWLLVALVRCRRLIDAS